MLKKFRTFIWKIAVFVLITVFSIIIIFTRNKAPVSRTQFTLDTICTVTLYNWSGSADNLLDGVFDLCERYENMLSVSVSSSDIYIINHSHGMPTKVSPETAELISHSIEYGRISGGAFDVTIYPVNQLWDFSGGSEIPEKSKLDHAVELVDYTKIQLDNDIVKLPDGMGIDLGAIAKGFIADKIAEYLRGNGVKSAVIDLGGNVMVIGNKPDGTNWRVGIQEPFGQSNIDVIEICDKSAVTSGIYQRYFEKDGVIYHHILNPADGMPCDLGLYSVTIIGENSEECDALSTLCMLLGYERGMEVLKNYPNVRAIFVTDKKELKYVS